MKYAILYESKTGNTEILARTIYDVLDTNSKICMKISDDMEIPDADMYFVGFPIRKKSCSMRVIDCLEEIEYGKVVLFATCGLKPTDQYRDKLEDSLTVWLPDEIEYKGLFLSQGKTSDSQQEIFCRENPEYIEYLTDMFEEGDTHPNENDLQRLEEFIGQII